MSIVMPAVVLFIVSVKIAPGAAEVRGNVTIGSNNVINPLATIIAEAGPIIIGTDNVINDGVVIINRLAPGETPSSTRVLRIGNNNVFGSESHSEALKIGNNNVFGSKCFVGREVQVTDNNVVNAGCRLTCQQVVGPNAVTCGYQCA
ncbi:dynactin subunit 6 [Anabrus simplex]|uniref:dynactin subunit 6 n=1 Tax=Anabrus simplex TaxID=316456 RepID=UPI0035A30E20